MNISIEKALELEHEAKQNGGKCTHCGHSINIYQYPINKVMVKFLRAMAKATDETGSREVDVEKVSVIHHERTQITKLRVHGLIAKVKDAKGKHKARTWIITTKGWDFLRGAPVARRVVIYNNQVIGHSGGDITIGRIDGDAGAYERQGITEPEAKVLSDVRNEPVKMTEYKAIYKGFSNGDLLKDAEYEVLVERLAMGKPVKMQVRVKHRKDPIAVEYNDIAAFQRMWQIKY